MKVTRPAAALLGLAAVAPLALMVLVPVLTPGLPANATYEEARANADLFGDIVLATIVLIYLVMGFFIFYTFRSSAVPAEKRKLWAFVLFFGSIVVLPFFWFWYVWQPAREEPGGT